MITIIMFSPPLLYSITLRCMERKSSRGRTDALTELMPFSTWCRRPWQRVVKCGARQDPPGPPSRSPGPAAASPARLAS